MTTIKQQMPDIRQFNLGRVSDPLTGDPIYIAAVQPRVPAPSRKA